MQRKAQAVIKSLLATARQLGGQSAMQVRWREQPARLVRGQSAIKSHSATARTLHGQSAMEYLMTYGWAVLVVVLVLAILMFLGVFNPRGIRGETCAFPPGYSCNSVYMENGSGSLSLKFGHAVGKTIMITRASCSKNETQTFQNLTNLTNNITISTGDAKWILGGDSGNSYNCTGYDAGPLSAREAEYGDIYAGNICIFYEEMDSGTTRMICTNMATRFENPSSGGGGEDAATPTPEPSETPAPTATPFYCPHCGDGICDATWESPCNCNADCPGTPWCLGAMPMCGNGACEKTYSPPESYDSENPCPQDCAPGCVPSPTPSPTPGGVITSCPYNITSPGYYTLNNSLGPYGFRCIRIYPEANGSTLDCQGYTITGLHDDTAIYAEGVNGVTIQDCEIVDYATSISVSQFVDGVITGNTISSGGTGIRLELTNTTEVTYNAFEDNVGGLECVECANNNIEGNDFVSTWGAPAVAIYWAASENNVFSGNTFTDSVDYDFQCTETGENIDDGNTCGHRDSCEWITSCPE